MVVLALIHFLGALTPLRGGSDIMLIVGVLATLLVTLGREVMRPENKQKEYAMKETCAHCSTTNAIGVLAVNRHGMGTVLRCPVCDTALIRIAHAKGRDFLDVRGVRVLQISAEA